MAVYNRYGTTSVFEGHGIAGEVLAAYEAVRRKGPPRTREFNVQPRLAEHHAGRRA